MDSGRKLFLCEEKQHLKKYTPLCGRQEGLIGFLKGTEKRFRFHVSLGRQERGLF